MNACLTPLCLTKLSSTDGLCSLFRHSRGYSVPAEWTGGQRGVLRSLCRMWVYHEYWYAVPIIEPLNLHNWSCLISSKLPQLHCHFASFHLVPIWPPALHLLVYCFSTWSPSGFSLASSQQTPRWVGRKGPSGTHQDGEGCREEEHGDRRCWWFGWTAWKEDHSQPEAQAWWDQPRTEGRGLLCYLLISCCFWWHSVLGGQYLSNGVFLCRHMQRWTQQQQPWRKSMRR